MPTLTELLIFVVGVIVLAQILTFVIDDLPWPRWHVKFPRWLLDWAERQVKSGKRKPKTAGR